jgi:hypothetical protein
MRVNSWYVILMVMLALCSSLHVMTGCRQDSSATAKAHSSKQPAANVFGARQLDPEVIQAEMNRAWHGYLASMDVVLPDDPIGMTEQEIHFIELETRQELPEDLKAFLRICLANGSDFNDGFEIMSAEQIVDWWKFLVELNYVHGPNGEPFDVPVVGATPTWFEPYLIPLMHWDVYEIHFDIRTGKVIEMLDGPCGIMANSLVELLDELAKQNQAGREVTSFGDGEEVGPFLKSDFWQVYEK